MSQMDTNLLVVFLKSQVEFFKYRERRGVPIKDILNGHGVNNAELLEYLEEVIDRLEGGYRLVQEEEG